MRTDKLLHKIYSGHIPASFKKFNILAISSDSRTVGHNSLFMALPGAKYDGSKFIDMAINRGARVIIKSGHSPEGVLVQSPSKQNVCILEVPDPRQFLKDIVRRFYADPSRTVRTIGVTGTNGKTTVTYLIEAILKKSGSPCGVLGTINYRIGSKVFPSPNTTPGVIENQDFLFKLKKKRIKYCVMEVSSHALDQGRVDLIGFRSAVFTNLTSDHLDYHKTTENYFQAKAKLFCSLAPQSYAVVNNDDPFGRRLVSMTKAKVLTYGINNPADIMACDIQLKVHGSEFVLKAGARSVRIKSHLIGQHNVYNILASVGAALSSNISLAHIVKGISSFAVVPGRLERIDEGQPFSVFVDYAHTEDGLKNVLGSLKKIAQAKIIVVFGCGGDRDRTKRPKMGAVASQLADHVILTNDNPRSEDPDAIAQEVIGGITGKNYEVLLDREQAIAQALRLAHKGDIVLIAGKGHEDYQIFKDRTVHFDDREVVRTLLSSEYQGVGCQ